MLSPPKNMLYIFFFVIQFICWWNVRFPCVVFPHSTTNDHYHNWINSADPQLNYRSPQMPASQFVLPAKMYSTFILNDFTSHLSNNIFGAKKKKNAAARTLKSFHHFTENGYCYWHLTAQQPPLSISFICPLDFREIQFFSFSHNVDLIYFVLALQRPWTSHSMDIDWAFCDKLKCVLRRQSIASDHLKCNKNVPFQSVAITINIIIFCLFLLFSVSTNIVWMVDYKQNGRNGQEQYSQRNRTEKRFVTE